MRIRTVLPFVAAFALAAPLTASADFVHTVSAGESLSSVAAQDGLSVAQLAAANGLPADSELIAGSSLSIPAQGAVGDVPSVSDTATTPVSATISAGGAYVVQPGETLSGIAAANGLSVEALAAANGLDPNGVLLSGSTLSFSGSSSVSATSGTGRSPASASGGYLVQPGDTLSAIAARAGTTVEALAAANGLDPNGLLLSGTALTLSGAPSSDATAAAQPIGAPAEGSPGDPPYPTPETVSASEVGSIAAGDDVSPSLAEAIGWQESGFNNDLISSADARGVMQILPGTWSWIQSSLAGDTLAPASATDNVRGGVLMLHSLLNSTGGDPAMAAAGYYQGLASVQEHGMYPSTQQYVNDVMALAARFGGG